MAKGMPSLLALLGLVAVAGYQHRDKIAGALGDMQKRADSRSGEEPGGLEGLISGIGGLFGGSGNADDNVLTAGLADLIDRFKSSGQGEVADSWVNPDVETRGLTPDEVERAVGAENLEELSRRTGLSRAELVQRLATEIPRQVDEMTPGGRMPTEQEARQRFSQAV